MEIPREDDQDRLEQIFLPHSWEQKRKFLDSESRFVHYTSAENAINILKSQTLWLRSPECMNDYMEISHGRAQLFYFFDDANRLQAFRGALEDVSTRLTDDVLSYFSNLWRIIEASIFIASISVHHKSEDKHGRLSMWRAYGGNSAKAALVFKNPPKSKNGLGVFLSPAAYFTYEDMERELFKIVDAIKSNNQFLKSFDRSIVQMMAVLSLIVLAVCQKHPGFREEEEWRLVYVPHLFDSQTKGWIRGDIENISGIPQTVYKLPLKSNEDLKLSGFAIGELLDKVIIGPTQFPNAIAEAFRVTMEQAGVQDARSKVELSNIPLRT